MTTLRTRTAALCLFAATLVAGCDPGSGSSSSSPAADDGNDDDDDGGDEGSVDDGDIYIRTFDVGDFTYSETLVYVWGECTTTRTFEGEGNGECSVGSVGVGVPQPDGSKVAGAIALCGRLTVTDVTTPASCDFDGSVTTDNTAVGGLTLSAPTGDDPMKLESGYDSKDFTLSTTVFAASALREIGTAKTFVLDASADGEDEGGTIHREVHVQVDVVVDK